MVKLVAEQQRTSLLPAQQSPVFSGNHFDYAAFISAFESLIECRVSDPKQRLYHLSQYTSGDAKKSIQGLVVSVVSATATCQEDVETGRCAKLVVCPT